MTHVPNLLFQAVPGKYRSCQLKREKCTLNRTEIRTEIRTENLIGSSRFFLLDFLQKKTNLFLSGTESFRFRILGSNFGSISVLFGSMNFAHFQNLLGSEKFVRF